MQLLGVIVAGGKSTRMGRDKASLTYDGISLLGRAQALMRASGTTKYFILGRPYIEHGLPDPLPDAGPAANLRAWINKREYPFKLTVLPIDMPLLSPTEVRLLTAEENGAYFDDLYLPFSATVTGPVEQDVVRMTELLSALKLTMIPVPDDAKERLKNVNTPGDFAALS